ncbi:MAG: hypothetical protein MJA30_23550 [Cytophagales bacterium]|nr:hypothetical protein [Cytophagales bacterium]
MDTELQRTEKTLRSLMLRHVPPLTARVNKTSQLEMAGTKEAMQGRQKVDGFYFGSIIPKPKDIRLYFFPIYTHPTEFTLSPSLQKCLKGKSCFHIKKLTEELEEEINTMITKGVSLYLSGGLV